jgi:hypothetical protein
MAYAEVLRGPLYLPEPAYDLGVAGRLPEVLGSVGECLKARIR